MSPFYFYIFLLCVCDVLALAFGRLSVTMKQPLYFWLAPLLLGLGGYFLAKSLRFEGVAIANIIWIAGSIIFSTLLGYFFFKEQLTLTQWAGMVVIIIGLVLVEWK